MDSLILKNPIHTIHLIDVLADKIEKLGGYDFDRRTAKEIRELCKDYIVNDKLLKKYIEVALKFHEEHGRVTPSLLGRHLKIDNYTASYVVDYMKENRLIK